MFNNVPHVLKTVVTDYRTGRVLDATGFRYDRYLTALHSLSSIIDLVEKFGGTVQEQTYDSVVYLYDSKLYHTWVEKIDV